MSEKFLAVWGLDDEFECLLITASDEATALQKYVENTAPTDNVLNDHVCDRSINAGLYEIFFRDENGYFMDDFTGDVRVTPGYTNQCARKNIMDFFGEHEDYANLYIEHIFKDESEIEGEECQFPAKMIILIALNIDWYSDVKFVRFSEIKGI